MCIYIWYDYHAENQYVQQVFLQMLSFYINIEHIFVISPDSRGWCSAINPVLWITLSSAEQNVINPMLIWYALKALMRTWHTTWYHYAIFISLVYITGVPHISVYSSTLLFHSHSLAIKNNLSCLIKKGSNPLLQFVYAWWILSHKHLYLMACGHPLV